MTATPTPGDLSARHVATLQTMIHQSDDGAICICAECRALKYAIAALSAAGWMVAEIMEASERDGAYLTHCNVRLRVYNGYVPAVGDSIYTTPQPSAAEANKTCGVCGSHRIRKHPKGTECMDCRTIHHHHAPVGAQGEAVAKVVRVTPMGPIVEWYDNQPVGTELFAHAAPAAEKGVDAEELRKLIFLWRIREDNGEELTEFDKGYEQASDEHAEQLEAALTRQPVAGDGMVLVPREPSPEQVRAGTLTGILTPNQASAAYQAMLAAAPAATPTDDEVLIMEVVSTNNLRR